MTARLSFPTAPLLIVWAIAAAPGLAQAEESAASNPVAQGHFDAGIEQIRGGGPRLERFRAAYAEFKAAYAASPTLTSLHNIAVCADQIERDGEALDAYQTYLDKSRGKGAWGIDKDERAVERLRAELARVTIDGPGTLSVIDTRVGPEPVVNRYGPFDGHAELRVRAGHHEFRVERPGASPETWTVALLPGDVAAHSFAADGAKGVTSDFEAAARAEPPPAPPEVQGPSHLPSYVLWGVGAGAAITSGIFYLESRHQQDLVDRHFWANCPSGANRADPACASVLDSNASAASWRTAALVTGLGGLGALVGGTVLYWLDSSSSARTEGTSSGMSVRAWLSPTGAGMSGTF